MNWSGQNNNRRILLIYPRQTGVRTANDAVFPFPFLGLPQVSALIPDHYQVTIRDEQITRITGKEAADIVFISSLTSTAFRAYELADIFRARHIPVVLGGVHVTVMPDEAAHHADAVVIGEAESIIQSLLADFEAGRLSPLYQSNCFTDLDQIPPPRTHLLNWRHRFYLSAIQTSRGCPHNCSFCAVPTISGKSIRLKSVATVERELRALQHYRSRSLFIVDDNFLVKKERCLAIIKLIKKFGFRWMAFSNLSVSEDDGFLAALKNSGCVSLFIGFESLNDHGKLNKNRQFKSREAMARAVSKIHAHGIGIQGSFIFGFDEDTPAVFQETVSFIQETGIELPNICIFTPFPGTSLYETMERENRLLHKDWAKYDMNHVVFQPRNMTPEELQQGYAWSLKYLASPTSILSRLRRRGGPGWHFLIANFSLHSAQTRLARSIWNPVVHNSLGKRLTCPH